MRQVSKVVEIPLATTAAQMETSLNTQLNKGWQLISIFSLGTKTFAILIRTIIA